jgi:hypothetical protein
MAHGQGIPFAITDTGSVAVASGFSMVCFKQCMYAHMSLKPSLGDKDLYSRYIQEF